MQQNKTIWTIGHSTRSFEEFIALLVPFNLSLVADIRAYPGSRRFPHFNKEALETNLPRHGIRYVHLPILGGRRKPDAGSKNTAWRNSAFRAYADFMETPAFHEGAETLAGLALHQNTAFMCSEAVWWRCHRALVADYLKFHGWKVLHIMGSEKVQEHPYTPPAKVVEGRLNYEN